MLLGGGWCLSSCRCLACPCSQSCATLSASLGTGGLVATGLLAMGSVVPLVHSGWAHRCRQQRAPHTGCLCCCCPCPACPGTRGLQPAALSLKTPLVCSKSCLKRGARTDLKPAASPSPCRWPRGIHTAKQDEHRGRCQGPQPAPLAWALCCKAAPSPSQSLLAPEAG